MLLHLTRVDDVMCFKHISFLFLVQKKKLDVNVDEKWNLLSIIVNIGKSRQFCLNKNINDSLFIKWDKRERVLSDITNPNCHCRFGHVQLFWSRWATSAWHSDRDGCGFPHREGKIHVWPRHSLSMSSVGLVWLHLTRSKSSAAAVECWSWLNDNLSTLLIAKEKGREGCGEYAYWC